MSHMIIRCTQQTATQVGVPGQTITFFLMPPQTQVRSAFSRGVYRGKGGVNTSQKHSLTSSLKGFCKFPHNHFYSTNTGKEEQNKNKTNVGTRFGGMLGVVKDQHITSGGLGGNDARILWHVASPVYLSLMINLNLNLYFATH